MPKRPRNSLSALPNFQRVSDFEAKGLTIKEAWQNYAKGCSRPYTYPHFSTLYKLWLADQATQGVDGALAEVSIEPTGFADYSADEDHLAELYWKKKSDR